MHRDDERPKRGFTLIELLVVISVIAILAAMLLPAVGMVRNSANASRCLNSQKQVALGCLAYANDQEGFLPALRLTSTPITLHWSDLIMRDYLEAGMMDANRTNYNRTALQGCPQWSQATAASTTRDRESAYGMNSSPLSENGTISLMNNDYLQADAALYARGITLQQITKQSTRIMVGDVLNTNGTSTYRINAASGTVTETTNAVNATSTLLKSWHTTGRLVTITMFDGHGEKRSITAAATAITAP